MVPRVLVVIPASNEGDLIKYSASSAALQRGRKINIDVVVVVAVNNSSDNTFQNVLGLSRSMSNIYGLDLGRIRGDSTFATDVATVFSVRYVEREMGFHWDYFILLDADTIMLPGYIESVVDALEEDRLAGIGGGIVVNEKRVRGHISATGMTIKRRVWEEIGGFNGIPASDTFFIMRAISRGWRVLVVKNARMMVLRPTGRLYGVKRCLEMGRGDGYTCYPFALSIARALRRAFQGPRCASGYLVGYIQARRYRDRELCRARHVVERYKLVSRLGLGVDAS